MAPRIDLLPVCTLWVSRWPDARGDHGTACGDRMTAEQRARCRAVLARTAQLGPGLLRAQHHLMVDEDVGAPPDMHAAEEAEVPLPLLTPIQRELCLTGCQHGL